MSTTPPGWFPAPDQSGRQQWWDGTQWTGQFSAGQQQLQPTRKSYLGLILGIVAVVVIGGIIGVFALIGVVRAGLHGLETSSDPSTLTVDEVPIYNISGRPGWDALVTRHQEYFDKYSAMIASEEMYTIVPRTDAGKTYYSDFLTILVDKKGALGFMSIGEDSTDPQELDDRIASMDAALTELERKLLANEDFGVTIKFTLPDGTVRETDGSFPTVDVDTSVGVIAGSGSNADANGSYLAAGQAMLDEFGMNFTWVPGTNESQCNSGDAIGANVLAYYCALDPGLIFLNSNLIDVNDPDFLDTVRHELAHHVINLTCGSGSPPVAGGSAEAVTNSYAFLFMGASEAIDDNSGAAYVMSAETDAAASAIHAGSCG